MVRPDAVFSGAAGVSFGNVKRNYFHGPGFNYTNLNLYKDFPLGAEKARYVEIRLEAYNAFNHANFGRAGRQLHGRARLLRGRYAVLGSTTADYNGDPTPGRAVQLVAKFYF